ncbi:glycoside hydrolase family 2 protein [Actinoplanes bogorensis]|uniref:Glycoside hydrolase family 2 protein n=1 Tax=Paractinoplanes bogorensis TaxID=1610840 RepID=A0ABS5YP69_9ACTN|nr:glycoside hydrolase family 2 protein [Actinoplanes bogorensis]MBU2664851.1 glycoside hydrolase family 2 protein [Actinoplanes bogorensis]
MSRIEQSLSGPWTVSGPPGDLPATVPGCVHTDLLAAGKIVDPFLGENEKAVDWVGRTDWVYSRDIAWDGPRPDRVELVFDGLDTVADIELGGVVIGSTRNMHRGYRFDVSALVGAEPQPLRVRFTSAYTEASRLQAQLGPRPNAYPEPFNFVRKMACSFGWDWGPTLVTAGIWRDVRLEGWSTARLSEVKPLLTYTDGRGRVDLSVTVERARPCNLRLRVRLDDRVLFDGPYAETLTFDVDDAEAWNPRGYGPATLHNLSVSLLDDGASDGGALEPVELDRWERRTGFRSVHIDQTGGQFVFHVNGEAVFVKGVNWIPDDIFPSRMTRERYALRLGQAAAAGVNLIRVWGGGLYESRDFYEVCDELGLMVWQDFLFACACYPEEEPLFSEVVAEARENVVRLTPYPSLVAWNGNNENLWLYGADDWASRPGGDRSWGETYYLKTLPDIVSEVDPTRPYMAGSPWSGSWEHEPNDVDHGTFHSWDVWNREDYLHYRDSAPRFVAEFGWQAPPAWRTLRSSVTDEPMRPDSPGVLHHQKAIDGNGKLARGLAAHFPETRTVAHSEPAVAAQPASGQPETRLVESGDGSTAAGSRSTEAWHFLTQLNQVRAVRTGIAHWRSHWPHTAGVILWQLNDLWPVISWAAIDGAGRYKPLWFEMRSLFAARSLTIQPRDGGLSVALMNDHAEPWAEVLTVERLDRDGTVLGSFEVSVEVAARSNSLIPVPGELTADGANPSDVLVARAAGVRETWFFEDFHLDAPGLTVDVRVVADGLDVTVRAAGLARDVLLQPDRIHPDATVDQGFVTLLPGESTTFRVRGAAALDPALVHAPWVLTDLATVLKE